MAITSFTWSRDRLLSHRANRRIASKGARFAMRDSTFPLGWRWGTRDAFLTMSDASRARTLILIFGFVGPGARRAARRLLSHQSERRLTTENEKIFTRAEPAFERKNDDQRHRSRNELPITPSVNDQQQYAARNRAARMSRLDASTN
jgi:hypothetical protein